MADGDGQGGAGAGGAGAGAGTGGTGATGAPGSATATLSIPEGYKEKPYLKGIDTPEKLFQMLDGAQELIGKRPAGIPAADAAPEEWAKFYDAVGRPKTAAEYTFELDPKVQVDEKILSKSKEIMYKNGLTAAQAKNLQKDFDAMALEIAKERGISLEKQNTDFNKLTAELFGADRDKIMARSKGLLDTFVPDKLKPLVATLPNETLMILAGVLNGIHAKYIKTDGAPASGGGGGSGSGETPETLRAEARALMGSPAYSNAMDSEHDNVCKKIDELYRRAAGQK